MALPAFVIAITAFLSGAVASVFIMLVLGIHAGDRAPRLSEAPGTPLDALTRKALGVGIRSSSSPGHADCEEN